jgi:plasmid maintenance system antidote protein VapI
MKKKANPHIGSSLDDFLKAEGIYEEMQTTAIKEVIAWQLDEAMKKKGVSRAGMAKMLHTSRTQVNRLLDPTADVTLSTLQRAAALVGRQVRLELV